MTEIQHIRGAPPDDKLHPPTREYFDPRPVVDKPSFWELLRQDELWYPKDADPIRIEDMTPEHRGNLIAWLRNRSLTIATAYTEEPWIAMGLFNGEMAQWSCEMEAYRRLDEVFGGHTQPPTSPEQWLESQPLMKRLVELNRRPPITEWEV